MSEMIMPSPPRRDTTSSEARYPRTPHQILGPYFPAVETPIATSDLTVVDGLDGRAQGEIIGVKGRVLNRNGDGVARARLVIWQANSFGRYAHPRTSNNSQSGRPARDTQLRRGAPDMDARQ
jgi:protocatechuate 3,4-dioxygenase beta subunit